jgi:mandelate racemase
MSTAAAGVVHDHPSYHADTALKIEAISARAVVAPLARPIRTAVGHIPSAPLVLIDLRATDGVLGRSYLFAYTPLALRPLVQFINDLGAELAGRPLVPVQLMNELNRRFRLIGWEGLIGMAVSGLDMAFWDALARVRNEPVVRLLGGEPRALSAYDSFGLVDVKADLPAIATAVESGFRAIKIKIGDGDLAHDVAIVSAVRQAIGSDIALMIDFNQSLDPVEARRRIARLAEFDLHWVEEPVEHEDLAGHARVRATSAVPIQTGENWWFPRDMEKAIAAGASDYAMLDVMKIGGVTGWMRAVALAQAASLPVSSHIFTEVSAHLLSVTPTMHWLEHLDIASAVLVEPHVATKGTMAPRGIGFGIEWDEKAVARYTA